MRILVVDKTAEGQTRLARMIESLDATDRDSLDVSVSLSAEQGFLSKLQQTDVLILGAALEETAHTLARQAKEAFPEIEILMFISDASYSSGTFRAAQIAKVRKVIPGSASPLDLLQELVSIHQYFCSSGRTRKGRLIVITHAKGSVGATSFVAALGELCAGSKQHTMLWDLDIESRDLSRALGVTGTHSQVVTAWINGTRDLTRDSLKEAYFPLSEYLSVLMPPHDFAARMDMVGHPDVAAMVQRIIELAKFLHDVIIVDTAGKLGPASGTLLRNADQIVVMVDDSLLGISAAHAFLESVLPLVKGNLQAVRMLCSGTKLPQAEIAKLISENLDLPRAAWSLPALPFDQAAGTWAGTGKSLFSTGQRSTRKALLDIAQGLGALNEQSSAALQEKTSVKSTRGGVLSVISPPSFLGKTLFGKASNA
ncbi:MAG: hypothetical protein DCC75_05070 [Proteobacteria bacterium]|nr:MAG: hypothetical protein DCC75_05070 [Pseudomonadota bacterium]